MISPTVGRKVWYRPSSGDIKNGMHVFGDQPLDATVIYVWGDRMVNLLVIDHGGICHARPSTALVQEGDTLPAVGDAYCEWMPYQKGQAARTEQAERAAGTTA